MSVLVVAISGSDGGNQGPQGIYKQFKSHWKDRDVIKVISIDTTPNQILANIEKVTQTVLKNQSYKSIYLVGYSMGGAVAALSAYHLSCELSSSVDGVVLIGTQTDGILSLSELNIPVLFYHGKEDLIFPIWQIDSVYKSIKASKKMVQIEGVGHNFAPAGKRYLSASDTKKLASDVVTEISSFILESKAQEKSLQSKVVTKELHLSQSKGILDKFRTSFFL